MSLLSRPVVTLNEDVADAGSLSEYLLSFISNALDIRFTRSQKLVATSIGSNFLGLITSLSIAFTSNVSPLLRWSNVATSLGSLILQILSLVEDKYKLSLDINIIGKLKDKILDYFVDNDGDFRFNATYSLEYLLRYGVGIISFILAIALKASGLSLIQMNAFLRVQQGLKSTSADIKTLILDSLEAMNLYNNNTNASFTEKVETLLKRAKESLSCSSAELLLNSATFQKLVTVMQDIVTFQNLKLTDEQNKIFSHSKTLLNSMYIKLLDKHKGALEVSDQDDRIVCTGFLVEGIAGVGKSTVARYILKCVAKKMGWSTNIYDISRGDNGSYNQIYLQQDLGLGNEFGGVREDGMVQQINSIISGDACNLEAAHVDFKHQRCNLKLVGLTSNRVTYDFTRQIHNEMNIAMMTRLIRINIEDPKFEGRGQANKHRKDGDYSHLNFKVFDPKYKMPKDMSEAAEGTFETVSLHELIKRLTQRCARESLSWVNRLLSENEAMTDEVRESIEARANQFKALLDDQQWLAQPNAGQRFFSVRWQGQPGSGKTAQLQEIAGFIKNNFRLPIVVWDSLESLMETVITPSVFILDDFDLVKYEKDILKAVNRSPKNSIFLVSTHHEAPYNREAWYKPLFLLALISVIFSDLVLCNLRYMWKNICQTWNSRRYYYDFSTNKSLIYNEVGLYRRLGAAGLIYTKHGFQDIGYSDSILVTKGKDKQRINDNDMRELKDIVATQYCEFVKQSGELAIKYGEECPSFAAEVTVCVKDVTGFLNAYGSAIDIPQLVNNANNPNGYVNLSDVTIKAIIESSSVNTWIKPKHYGDINQLIIDLAYTINSLSQEITCRAVIPGRCFSLVKGTLFIQDTINCPNMCIQDDHVYYQMREVPTNIVRFCVHGYEAVDDMCGFNVMEALEIASYVKDNLYDPRLALYRSAYEREELYRKQCNFYKKHPFLAWCSSSQGGKVFVALGGAFLGLVTVIIGTKKLYNLFTCPNVTANGMQNFSSPARDSNRSNNKIRKNFDRENNVYQRGLNMGRWNNRAAYKEHLAAQGYSEHETNAWERQITTASYNAIHPATYGRYIGRIAQAIHDEKIDYARQLYEEFTVENDLSFDDLVHLLRAKPNAVAQRYELNHQPSILDPIIRITRKALVTVHSRMVCYGIMIGGNKVLTVNHAIDVSDISIAVSEGNTRMFYEATLVTRSVVKDLAILQIESKTFTAKRSLEKFFPDDSTKSDWNQKCFYVRPLEQTLVVAGVGNYITNGRTPGRDSDVDIYAPTDYIKFDSFTMVDVAQIYKPGDCGMPLIAVSENKCYIVGIHNAYNNSGTAWFSPLFREEIYKNQIELAYINATDRLPMSIVKPMQELSMVSVPDYNPWLETATGNPWSSHEEIPVIGYSKELHYFSKPRTVKQKIRSPECKLDTTLCPSPTTLSQLTPEAREFLPKDDKGIPSPLLAQTKKMFKRLPYSANEEYLVIATDILKDEFAINYGKTNRLRMHEVINGKLDGPLKRLNLATSCGPYIKKKYGLVDKTKIFRDINSGDPLKPYTLIFTDHPASFETREQYDQICNLWEQGILTAIVIKDNPKVEMASIEEVEAEGKLRLFCEMDLATNMAYKRYFGSLTNEMMINHSTSPCKVGFNPYKLPTYLFKYIPSNFETYSSDLKRMDKQLPMRLLLAFAEIAASTTNDVLHKNAIFASIKSLGITIHIQSGVIYYTFAGNPSGISITTIMNTTIRELGCVYTFVKINFEYLERPHLCCYAAYLQAIVSAKLGDDEFVAADPKYGMTFEQSRQAWEELGLELIRSKNSSLDDFCSRELERSDDGILYPRLKKESVKASLYWIDKSNMSDIGLVFTNVLFEATLWDKDFYEDIKHDVLAQMKYLRVPYHKVFIPTYERQRTHFAKYVLGQEKSPMYLVSPEVAEEYLGIDVDIKTPLDNITDYCRIFHLTTVPNDPRRLEIEYEYSKALTSWITNLKYGSVRGVGHHARKNISKQLAFKDLITTRDDADNLSGPVISTNTG